MARIIRVSGRSRKFFAVTAIRLFRNQIYVDYNQLAISPALENFVIAHELGHYKSNDPQRIRIFQSAGCGLFSTLALETTQGFQNIVFGMTIGSAVVTAGVLLVVLPLGKRLRGMMESSADKFAEGLIGHRAAVDAMTELRKDVAEALEPAPDVVRELDRRIRCRENDTKPSID